MQYHPYWLYYVHVCIMNLMCKWPWSDSSPQNIEILSSFTHPKYIFKYLQMI